MAIVELRHKGAACRSHVSLYTAGALWPAIWYPSSDEVSTRLWRWRRQLDRAGLLRDALFATKEVPGEGLEPSTPHGTGA